MTTRSDLSPDQWQLISDAPHWVYVIFRMAEGSGLFSRGIIEKIKESRAFSDFIEGYATQQPLIKDTLAAALAEEPSEIGLSEEKAVAALGSVADILDGIEAAEADAFKVFLLDEAQTIAEASGEGIFGTGEKVSDTEVQAAARIIQALRADHLAHPFLALLAERAAEEA